MAKESKNVFTELIHTRVRPEAKKMIEARAKAEGKSSSEFVRDIIEESYTIDILEKNKDALREVVREEVQREMKPAVERLAGLQVKNFMQAAEANILFQKLLMMFLELPDATDEEKAVYIKDMVDDAYKQALLLLKTRINE